MNEIKQTWTKKWTKKQTWILGHHPFEYFSQYPGISKLSLDAIRRNTIISRVDQVIRTSQEKIDEIDEFANVMKIKIINQIKEEEKEIKISTK